MTEAHPFDVFQIAGVRGHIDAEVVRARTVGLLFVREDGRAAEIELPRTEPLVAFLEENERDGRPVIRLRARGSWRDAFASLHLLRGLRPLWTPETVVLETLSDTNYVRREIRLPTRRLTVTPVAGGLPPFERELRPMGMVWLFSAAARKEYTLSERLGQALLPNLAALLYLIAYPLILLVRHIRALGRAAGVLATAALAFGIVAFLSGLFSTFWTLAAGG